jgi:hypothetical protein|tara:strand:- start:1827 stop:2108 length:282 start_codon:yes stop_codon:yes gene_type:complete
MLRASTADVLGKSMPKLITLDGVNAPDTLSFSIEDEWIPARMIRNAHELVKDPSRTIYRCKRVDAKGVSHDFFYVLSLSQTTHRRITPELVAR